MCAVVFVITDVLYDEPWAAIVAALAAAMFAWVWYVTPLRRRYSGDPRPRSVP